MGDWVAGGTSIQVPLSGMWSLGQMHTGPLGLSRHNHSHFFLSHGLGTVKKKKKECTLDWEKTHAFLMHPKHTLTQTLTLRLFVAVIEGYVSGVVDASGQILRLAYTKLVNPEDNVIGVGNPINVILKDINAEGVEEICKKEREAE